MADYTLDMVMNSFSNWYSAVGLFIFIIILRGFYKFISRHIAHFIQNKFGVELEEDTLLAFDKPIKLLLLILAFYLLLTMSPVKGLANNPLLDRIIRSAVIFSMIWGLYNLFNASHGIFTKILDRAGLATDQAVANIVATFLHILVVCLGFVMIAKEWNYDISAFIASLGIGSLAIALAAKDALSNVFGSLTILLDKPFKIGHWIKANDIEGVVESISFRSTCIRTFDQELVYIPNSILANTAIINYTLREKRRINYNFGLTYNTTIEQMQKVVADIKTFLSQAEGIDNHDFNVNFFDFGDSALFIKIVCYSNSPEQNQYLDTKEKLNLQLLRIVEQNHVSCAFPSTSLYFENKLQTQQEVDKKDKSPAAAPEQPR
jgi:MscS family membrane protein